MADGNRHMEDIGGGRKEIVYGKIKCGDFTRNRVTLFLVGFGFEQLAFRRSRKERKQCTGHAYGIQYFFFCPQNEEVLPIPYLYDARPKRNFKKIKNRRRTI